MSDESFCSCQIFESNGKMPMWRPSNSHIGVMEQMKCKALVQVQFQHTERLPVSQQNCPWIKMNPIWEAEHFNIHHILWLYCEVEAAWKEREYCWKRHLTATPEHAGNLARTAAHKRCSVCPFSPELLPNSLALLSSSPVSLIYLERWLIYPRQWEMWPLRDVVTRL